MLCSTRPAGEVAPGHVSAISAKANFERRSGSAAAACAAFESALSAPAPPAGEPSDDHIELLFLHYARFASHGLGDDAAARAVYERAVVTLPLRASIWEAFLAFEAAAHPPSAEKLGRVAAVIDRASAEPAEGTEARATARFDSMRRKIVWGLPRMAFHKRSLFTDTDRLEGISRILRSSVSPPTRTLLPPLPAPLPSPYAFGFSGPVRGGEGAVRYSRSGPGGPPWGCGRCPEGDGGVAELRSAADLSWSSRLASDSTWGCCSVIPSP